MDSKELLLKDLCARLPYGVKCDRYGKAYELVEMDIKRGLVYLWKYDRFDPTSLPYSIPSGDEIKPYLRPMSSITEEEKREYFDITQVDNHCAAIDWLNEHHFDYRGLIEKGLGIDCTGLHIYD